MSHRVSTFCLTLAALLGAGAAFATTDSLLNNNPFLPSGGPAVPTQQAARLELRGMFSLGGAPSFAIFDTTTQKAFWLGLNQAEGNVRVVGYDPATNAVSAEVDGQPQRLVMKEAQIITMVAPPPTPVAAAAGANPGGPGLVAGSAPSEQEIQERRNRIIEELRRRRAMRMGQPPPAPGQPPPSAPVPQ